MAIYNSVTDRFKIIIIKQKTWCIFWRFGKKFVKDILYKCYENEIVYFSCKNHTGDMRTFRKLFFYKLHILLWPFFQPLIYRKLIFYRSKASKKFNIFYILKKKIFNVILNYYYYPTILFYTITEKINLKCTGLYTYTYQPFKRHFRIKVITWKFKVLK